MTEPVTHINLEAPGGLVSVEARCTDGRVRSVVVRNVPSFVYKLEQSIVVEGVGSIDVDIAYGGDSFAIVDADTLGVSIEPANARRLAELGVRISEAATEQAGFEHPGNPDWRHVSFCLFCTKPDRHGEELRTRHAVAIRPGKIDRSPTGTGVSARLAVLNARGEADESTRLVATSIIGSRFIGRITSTTTVGSLPAVVPSIEGRAWVSGRRKLLLDPHDPWPLGYRVADTWPGAT